MGTMADKELQGFLKFFSLVWEIHDANTRSPQIAPSSILKEYITFKLLIGLVD